MEIDNFKIIVNSNSQYIKLCKILNQETDNYSPFINPKKIYLYYAGYLHWCTDKEIYDKLKYEELTFQEFKNKYFLEQERAKKLRRLNDLTS